MFVRARFRASTSHSPLEGHFPRHVPPGLPLWLVCQGSASVGNLGSPSTRHRNRYTRSNVCQTVDIPTFMANERGWLNLLRSVAIKGIPWGAWLSEIP
jgi:hypothetical protein